MDRQDTKIDVLQCVLWSLALISLSLWLGGLIAIGAIVAPQTFHLLRGDPSLVGQVDVQNHLAAGIIGGSFRIFNKLCEVCGFILTISTISATQFGGFAGIKRKLGVGTSFATIALTLTAVYLDYSVFPAMDGARAVGNTADFDRLHALYVNVSNVQLLGLLAVVLGIALMFSMRTSTRSEQL